MNYATWLTYIMTILQISDPSGAAAFEAVVGMIIQRAENLIYMDPELDFLVLRDTDVSQSTVNGRRDVPIPSSMIVVEAVNVVTPANTLPYAAGAMRIPLSRKTRQFIDLVWPIESQVQAPNPLIDNYYAIFDMEQASPAPGEDEPTPLPSSIMIAPTPDDSYRVEFSGVVIPPPLTATNSATFLTTWFPALFLAATVVIGTGYQRDWSAQADDPKMAVSWTDEYEKQKAAAVAISRRQKSLMDGFSPTAKPAPLLPAQVRGMAGGVPGLAA